VNWTQEQSKVIYHETGHAKVEAVAGSGKSATLVERIARLVENGTPANEIMAIMFNKSARTSFEQRLQKRLMGTRVSFAPKVNTFHSLGRELCLRLESQGVLPRYELEVRDWVEAEMAKAALKEVSPVPIENEIVESFCEYIQLVKSDIASPEDKHSDAEAIAGKEMPTYFIDAFNTFERLRHENRIRFFNDLIYDPVLLLVDKPELFDMKGRYSQIIIDEYQDINEIQQILVTLLAGDNTSVMVVGDVDQTIYSWLGAAPHYIRLLFDVDFPNPAKYTLSYTFRYGHQVSLLANHVIAHNQDRDNKLCLSYPGTPHTQIYREDDSRQDERILQIIDDKVKAGGSLSDIAVMVRLYGSAADIELSLLRARIPYINHGGKTVLQQAETHMVFGYLSAACHKERFVSECAYDQYLKDSLIAMYMAPAVGAKKTAVESIVQRAIGLQGDLVRAIKLEAQDGRIADWVMDKLLKRTEVITEIMNGSSSDEPCSAFFAKLESRLNLFKTIEHNAPRREVAQDKIALYQSLFSFGSREGTVKEFHDALVGARYSLNAAKETDAVQIISIHKAKGLEFPVVIMPCVSEGAMPAGADRKSEEEMESERRLFYVGITRAINALYLFHPTDKELEYRLSHGWSSSPGGNTAASRFLYESNFDLSRDVGASLCCGFEEEFVGHSIEICQSYLDALNETSIALTEKAELPQENRLVAGPGVPCIAESGMKVRCEKYGEGVVTGVVPRANTFIIHCSFAGKDRIVAANLTELYLA
jgi:DNA helicase-2/ATP-dependent DNA helicase PcrA